MSRNTNTNRTSRPSSSVYPPPSSIYSHSTQPSIPVSPLSTPQQQPVSTNPDPFTPARTAAAPSHRRPSSTAFFRPLAHPAAYSTASINPFGSVPTAAGGRGRGNNSGYDGAWDTRRPSSGRSSVGGGDNNRERSQRSSSDSRSRNRSRNRSRHTGGGSTSGSGGSSGTGTGNGKDKEKAKGKKKPSSSSCLKVDKDSLSSAAKMGIWLMGTTPRKLENAAQAQKNRREWEREEKRARREARRNGRGRGVDGGYGEEEEEGGVEVWEDGEGGGEWDGEKEDLEEERASTRSMV